MALLFIDGFDHLASADLALKWDARTLGAGSALLDVDASAGRNGSGALKVSTNAGGSINTEHSVQYNTQSQASYVIGFAFKHNLDTGTAAVTVLQLMDATSVQLSLSLNQDKTLSLFRSTNTTLTGGTTTQSIPANVWVYVELKVTIADSIAAGSCKIRINGVDAATVATGQDTKFSSNAYATAIKFGKMSSSFIVAGNEILFDDLYICDSSGTANNDFLGDVMVQVLRPSGAGNSAQFTPSAGANWQCVDETQENGDTDYVESNTAGHIDLYAMGNLPVTPESIKGIQWVSCVRKTDAGNYVARRVVRSGSTNYEGTTSHAPGTSYRFAREIIEQDPATSAAWTKSGVDAAEFGIKLQSVS
jgi:hypothetical protein